MANPEHLEILQRGVAAWNRWYEDTHDVQPDLSEANLSGANLVGVNLIGAFLRDVNLSGACLEGADLSGTNVEEADLHQANLRAVVLGDANLSYANLRGADLREIVLKGTLLKGADLSESNLEGADLAGALLNNVDLSRANLSRADLSRATISYANLSSADLSQAIVGRTIFADSDLRAVKGLETVRHLRPSTIGIETLCRSGGNLPEAFLRGCGVSEGFIAFAQSRLGPAAEFYPCFISYSHEDESFATRVHDRLQASGIRCWLNGHQHPAMNDLDEQDRMGTRLWDKVLLCASRYAVASWWIEGEVDAALEKERRLVNDRASQASAMILLNLDDSFLTEEWDREDARQIRSRPAVDFSDWERNDAWFERQLKLVVKALRRAAD